MKPKEMASADSLPTPSTRLSSRSWVALLLAVVAFVAAAAASYAPWYTISNDTRNFHYENHTIDISSTTTFLPGPDYRYLCTTTPTSAPIWGPICADTQPNGVPQSYASLPPLIGTSSSVGAIYGEVQWLSLLGAVTGGAAMLAYLLALRKRFPTRLTVASVAALVVAGSLAIGVAAGVASEQPGAVTHDECTGSSWCSAPVGFWGSCGPSPSSCGIPQVNNANNTTETSSWGPTTGWYLEVAAGLLFIGLAVDTMARRRRRRSPSDGSRKHPVE